MAEDDYNYDFSDEESEVKGTADAPSPERDDEQQMQKINGMMETYQKQLSDIQASLDKEKAAHDQTRKSMTVSPASEAAELRRELAAMEAAHQEERQRWESELEQAKHAAAPSPGKHLAKAMKAKLDTVAKLFAIETTYANEHDMTERDGLDILAELSERAPPSAGRRARTASPVKPKSAPVEGDGDLLKRITLLEEELRLALGAAEDIRALKSKVIQLVERLRIEKEDKISANLEVKRYSKKMDMLGDHVEKLMLHLKHEAGTKIKVSDQLKDSERRNNVLQDKNINLTKKLGAKDRLISELREGSKILEDQLRLMDEKYLELRTKLDYTRDAGAKKIKKAQKMASELRVKFALAGNSTLLDHIPMPSGSMANTAPAGGLRQNNSDSFDYNLNAVTGPGTTGGVRHNSGSKQKSKGKDPQKGSFAWDQAPALSNEENELRVLEKVRKLQGGKTEWTDDKIQELLKQR